MRKRAEPLSSSTTIGSRVQRHSTSAERSKHRPVENGGIFDFVASNCGLYEFFPPEWNFTTVVALPAYGSNSLHGATAMNWDRIQGNWKQFKGKAQQQWGELTDDDLDVVEGKREELVGRLQQRYGYARDQAEREVDNWLGSVG
jgi:uncharacterized protein YjbJ (UPF0337 family)